MHEFVLSLSVHVLFKKKLAATRLSKKEFVATMEDTYYFVVAPDYLRVKATEYVNFNRGLALQPARSQRDTRVSSKRKTLHKTLTSPKQKTSA